MSTTTTRTLPVIAVFGSSDGATLPGADAVGAEVARRGMILLTGGGRGHGRPAVKESAFDGARRARREEGVAAARVGVLGREAKQVEVRIEDHGTEIILAPALKDRRNYLNASMCDVAIAFQGGEGTKSEVAFCLGLGRPVLLVGPLWGQEYPVIREQAALDSFLQASKHRVPGGDADALDRLIRDVYRRLAAGGDVDVEHRPLDHPVADIVDSVRRRAVDTGLIGVFPDLDDPTRAPLAEAYDAWVADLAERHGDAG